ncbi:MAG: polysaccharide biosynthesis/export family protein [Gemmataceae bacterium]|nr:polysaccharide biosynthesis/export family protein [Gemmataceae bacterium]
MSFPRGQRLLGMLIVSFALSTVTGCVHRRGFVVSEAPTELAKVNLPEHVIAPPDILLIDAASLVPRPPYRIKPLDALVIQVKIFGVKDDDKRSSLVPGQPIEGIYRIEPDGTVNLGFDYGLIKISGMTIPDAKNAIKANLGKRFKVDFDVFVTLAESRALQQIRGEHLVEPDGKVTLGTYGTVNVTGLTLDQARAALQTHLAAFLVDPEISLSIAGFNSRVYYVLFDLDGAGQQVYRLPITGNETVLDAVAELKGLPGGTARKRIWVARPSPTDPQCGQVLRVDWDSVSSCASTATNYQLLPGDRVYVSVDPFVRADNLLAKVLSPIERILGITLLGNTTVRSFTDRNNEGSGFGF